MKLGARNELVAITAVLVVIAVIAIVLGFANSSAMADAAPDCSGDRVIDIDSTQLFSPGPAEAIVDLSNPIPAGTYELNGRSFDGHAGRELAIAQPEEIWFVEFLDGNDEVLATSEETEDLEDEVAEAGWSGGIGQVDLTADAVALRFVHAAPGTTNANSVSPTCIGLVGEGSSNLGATADAPATSAVEAEATETDDTDVAEADAAADATVDEAAPVDDTEATDIEDDVADADAADGAAETPATSDADATDDSTRELTTEVEGAVLENMLENMAEADVAVAQPGMPTFTG